MTDAIDLTQEQRNQLSALLRRFLPGVAVWAYGSRVKWTARPNSDLDLVAFTTPAQSPQVAELKDALAESNLPFPVDLHVWDDVPERFREIIRKEYVVVQETKQPESGSGDLEIPGEWQTLTVDQIKANEDRAIAIGPFGSRMKADTYMPKGVPVNRGNNISDTLALVDDFVYVSDRTADELRSCNVFAGDLVFPHRGAIGQVGIIPQGEFPRYMLSTSLMKLTCNKSLVDPLFIFYYFRSPLGRHALLEHASTVGTPGIGQPLTSLRSIRMPVPPLGEQRAIAHILGTLDDKIELNRKMNETLETMARALFKSWFVDFDPVRTKAEGRDSGLPKPLADLFPDSFEDSEMGEIPKGWEVRAIYEIADVVYGAPFASSQFNTEGIGEPLIRIRDLADESPGVWTPEVHPKGYKVRPGDIVVGMDGEFRAYLWGGAEAWLNQRVCVFLPKGDYTAAFVRNSIIEPLAHVESTETATTVIHLGKSDIDRFCVVAPTASVLAAFNQSCQPWYDRIVAAKRETRTLAALRDTLLPKLISGELRVKDAERFVEAAT